MGCTTTSSSWPLLRPCGVGSVSADGHTSDSAVDWSSLRVYPFPSRDLHESRSAPTIVEGHERQAQGLQVCVDSLCCDLLTQECHPDKRHTPEVDGWSKDLYPLGA